MNDSTMAVGVANEGSKGSPEKTAGGTPSATSGAQQHRVDRPSFTLDARFTLRRVVRVRTATVGNKRQRQQGHRAVLVGGRVRVCFRYIAGG